MYMYTLHKKTETSSRFFIVCNLDTNIYMYDLASNKKGLMLD